ncbi:MULTISPECIES: MerR family transcriptional regulator [unclassified Pseudomonas]|jgi:MerR family copper efflux transcriptional regulator|uniref:MerR family transcriptional regulator n=1 Tax=unclassified Pseudomonas TaxID=196821 RepID=UPI000BA3AE06|nr:MULTISPECIES: MerR family transcriptional regulator [unclassified Pseudomonas]MCU1734269.1 MerR family transcriptional regulator [Pseudomonas sp. 20P_3.2_Bac4]MCU1746132.1 MerR family transcriptional regulator [Pseudomonas sp. 20P_3.2_Bac5]
MYIGEAARLSGTTIKCIRHYESIGLLPPAKRQGKYRIYDPHDVELLALIKCAQRLGFTLREMQALMADGQISLERARQAIAGKSTQLRQRIDDLQRQFDELQAFDANLQQITDTCFPPL